mgnify:FL=1|jgi:hypothetical protein|tara:strand:- start:1430 stop:1819 length:390 start_codon:yes stop_codon:yes gene_type:complete
MSINVSGALQMYLSGGRNVKSNLSSAATTTLYTTPSVATFNFSIISSVRVSNTSSGSNILTLKVNDGTTNFTVAQTVEVAGNSNVSLLMQHFGENDDLILNSGELLTLTTSTSNAITVFTNIFEFANYR